ncbi:uncharacterized protein N7511_009369 [Penicillium nucicola]|uniref:uncharacterized protein n=1 Tax=Penicillium nucicola TaxID=1850975 RepID=UPI002544FD9F|nr:uncharacterized protein N7511_009369 [Penicillium nucicola]KAJ5747673.1 hypothetical protein N7511_009369 [Penicillium nucicola]
MGYTVIISHPASRHSKAQSTKSNQSQRSKDPPEKPPTLKQDHQIFITIHHRNELSLDKSRRDLGSSAYHWGILLAPRRSRGANCHAFDVTDGSSPDPLVRKDNNPNFEWKFRVKKNVNPDHSGSLLLRIRIGKIRDSNSSGHAFDNIDTLLRSIPLPVKDNDRSTPSQNCVGWVQAAIRKLQMNGLAEDFDVDFFMANALAFVDRRLADVDHVPGVINHLGKRIRSGCY